MSKGRVKGYQISADLKLVKNTAREMVNQQTHLEKSVMSGYRNYEQLFNSNRSSYLERGIVALCEGCGAELKLVQKDSRGIVVCDSCLNYSSRGIAALCCDCDKELTESQIAFERGTITKCASCASISGDLVQGYTDQELATLALKFGVGIVLVMSVLWLI